MRDFTDRFDKIYKQALKEAMFLEPWQGHYLSRKVEAEILSHKFDFKPDYIGLEIGCGNAFQSILLASLTKRIFATDLCMENSCTHSLGINKAKALIDKLNIKNVTLVSCSGAGLPFSDNYFDFVFSSSALEHMDNKDIALKEMKRVLKPGGRLIAIVPNHMPSLYAFAHVYLYFLARIVRLFFKSGNKFNKTGGSEQASLLARFRKNHPSFPMPEPHGSYRNVFHELFSQLPFNWERMFRKNGFAVKNSFGVCLFPWLLIEPFSTKACARIFSSTKVLNMKLSSLRPLKYASYLMGVVAVKNGGGEIYAA